MCYVLCYVHCFYLLFWQVIILQHNMNMNVNMKIILPSNLFHFLKRLYSNAITGVRTSGVS